MELSQNISRRDAWDPLGRCHVKETASGCYVPQASCRSKADMSWESVRDQLYRPKEKMDYTPDDPHEDRL